MLRHHREGFTTKTNSFHLKAALSLVETLTTESGDTPLPDDKPENESQATSHYLNHRGSNLLITVIMSAMASQITSLTIVYIGVYLGADQRKHQSSASLAFVRGIHRWPVISPHKGPVTRKMFPFDDVIMDAKSLPRLWAQHSCKTHNLSVSRHRKILNKTT